MNRTERVLVVQRETDGLFFQENRSQHVTSPEFVTDPIVATFITPNNEDDILDPREATYYFENSCRMRSWLADCKMVAYEAVTKIEMRPFKPAMDEVDK